MVRILVIGVPNVNCWSGTLTYIPTEGREYDGSEEQIGKENWNEHESADSDPVELLERVHDGHEAVAVETARE